MQRRCGPDDLYPRPIAVDCPSEFQSRGERHRQQHQRTFVHDSLDQKTNLRRQHFDEDVEGVEVGRVVQVLGIDRQASAVARRQFRPAVRRPGGAEVGEDSPDAFPLPRGEREAGNGGPLLKPSDFSPRDDVLTS
jgi:hypothetical protein